MGSFVDSTCNKDRGIFWQIFRMDNGYMIVCAVFVVAKSGLLSSNYGESNGEYTNGTKADALRQDVHHGHPHHS